MVFIRKFAGVSLFLFLLVFTFPLFSQSLRSLDDIFPGLTQSQKENVFTNAGFKRTFEKNDSPRLTPSPNSGVNLVDAVLDKSPSHLVEILLVVPYNEKALDRLDIYNAIGRINNIKDHLYFSRERQKNIVIFRETTRLTSATNRNPVSDPPPATVLPSSETMYLRFDDPNFGSLYIRGDISISRNGITCNMTNFEPVRFLVFTIMKAEKFSTIVYIEPVSEGILIYGMAGIYIPGVVAGLINVPYEVEKRLTVLVNWVIDGLKKQDNPNYYADNTAVPFRRLFSTMSGN